MSYHKLIKSESEANATRVSHLGKPPQLTHGQDDKRAKELEQYIDDAESGLRSILKAGFFLECLAEDLPKGQLGPWVEAHCKNRTWRTVQRWKEIAGGVGEAVGVSYKNRIGMKLHEVLALPLNKVPENLKAIREKIDAEIAGKSYRQLFLELKQYDEDTGKPKRGRLKGSSGLTKEMREHAALRAEEERLNELEEAILERNDWLLEIADAKNLGMMESKLLKKFVDAADTASGFAKRTLESRSNNGGAK